MKATETEPKLPTPGVPFAGTRTYIATMIVSEMIPFTGFIQEHRAFEFDADCEEEYAVSGEQRTPLLDKAREAMGTLSFTQWQRARVVSVRAKHPSAPKLRAALIRIKTVLEAPAANQRLMQVAGPARRCLNIIKEAGL